MMAGMGWREWCRDSELLGIACIAGRWGVCILDLVTPWVDNCDGERGILDGWMDGWIFTLEGLDVDGQGLHTEVQQNLNLNLNLKA